MKYIVDRIEGDIAVLESNDNKMIEVSIYELPSKVHDGTALIYNDGKYSIDEEYEKERKKTIEEKFNRLKSKDN